MFGSVSCFVALLTERLPLLHHASYHINVSRLYNPTFDTLLLAPQRVFSVLTFPLALRRCNAFLSSGKTHSTTRFAADSYTVA